jgi:alanyl-tRNA synthetase
MPLDKARESGAEALFGEKYDNEVRVVSMLPSIELCGGTHVKATGNIGIFKIISEKGIAAGIRRIEAISGVEVIDYYRKQKEKSENAIENLQQELKKKDKEIEKLKKEKLSGNAASFSVIKIGNLNLVHHCFEGMNAKELRDLTTEIKNKKEYQNNSVILFFAESEGKVSVVLAVSSDLVGKFDASKLIGKVVEKLDGKGGGGKPDLAMGGGANKNGIKDAVLTIKNILES